MNARQLMRTASMALFFSISALFVYAQGTIDPKISEVWEPKPPKVKPGEGHQPPSDAKVLFDGKNLDKWESSNGGSAEWKVENGVFTVVPGKGGIQTKESFGDVQLHIEFMTPTDPQGEEGQNRGNSGIFLQGLYEVQVLDSHGGETYANGQAGSIYKQGIPLVNATLPAGVWQTYDIIFQSPLFKEDGSLGRPAAVTILHNGVLVQNHFILRGPTEYDRWPVYKAHAYKLPLSLQDHGNKVSYRNIWIREL